MLENNQLSLNNGLYARERDALLLIDSLGRAIKSTHYLKQQLEATCGNYDSSSKQHKRLALVAKSINYVLYWTATIQSLSYAELSTKVDKKQPEEFIPKDNGGYSLSMISTPHGLYESYLRVYRELERAIKRSQHVIDRLPKGNDLVVSLVDSLQDGGTYLEDIL